MKTNSCLYPVKNSPFTRNTCRLKHGTTVVLARPSRLLLLVLLGATSTLIVRTHDTQKPTCSSIFFLQIMFWPIYTSPEASFHAERGGQMPREHPATDSSIRCSWSNARCLYLASLAAFAIYFIDASRFAIRLYIYIYILYNIIIIILYNYYI